MANPSYHPGRVRPMCMPVNRSGGGRVWARSTPWVARNYGVDAELYCAELAFGPPCTPPRGPIPEYVPSAQVPRRHPGHRRGV